MNIGEKFKAVRNHLKLSQAAMAGKLGIKQSYYSAIERGVQEPSDNVLKMLFETNRVNQVWFYEDRGNMFNFNPIPKNRIEAEKQLKVAITNYKREAKAQKDRLLSELASENKNYVELLKLLAKLTDNISSLNAISANCFEVYDPEDTSALVSHFSDSIGLAPYEDYKADVDRKIADLYPLFTNLKNLNTSISRSLDLLKMRGIGDPGLYP